MAPTTVIPREPEYINSIADETKHQDSFTILRMMEEITGSKPKMWGSSIIGFGDTHYQYESGREGDWFQVGFSPRKQNLTLYLPNNIMSQVDLLRRLGKHKTGKACLYIKKLADIDQAVLKEIMKRSIGR